jgi:UDP-N-acetylmuramoyl-tripeptide--D-alanyl-D-alanine ligase
MLPLTLQRVAEAVGGSLQGGDPGLVVHAVSIDSRTVQPGEVYIGLRGERFDGDTFAAEALRKGAAAVVVRAETAAGLPAAAGRIVVEDGLAALASLAAFVRDLSDVRVVAITGSAGKTSTKDILAAMLRPVARAVATQGNLNNEIGLPLTLLAVDRTTEVVVCEMAMRGHGQIRALARLAKPDIGVIINIAPVHLELVGTIEDVAAAKAELIEELAAGSLVVPADEPLLAAHVRRHRGRVVTFGSPAASVHVVEAEPRNGGTHALVDAFGRRAVFDFNFGGAHYLVDAQAALAAFVELGHNLDEAKAGARQVEFSKLRGEIIALPGDGVLLNDAYNANPLSMVAALDHLVELGGGRELVAIIGDMCELGAGAPGFHRSVGEHAAGLGVRVVAVGELARHYLIGAPNETWFATVEACVDDLPNVLHGGEAVLVKASRAVALERVADALRPQAGGEEDERV